MSGCCDRILLELAAKPFSETEMRRQVFEDRVALLSRRLRKFRRQQAAGETLIFRFSSSHLTSLQWRKRA